MLESTATCRRERDAQAHPESDRRRPGFRRLLAADHDRRTDALRAAAGQRTARGHLGTRSARLGRPALLDRRGVSAGSRLPPGAPLEVGRERAARAPARGLGAARGAGTHGPGGGGRPGPGAAAHPGGADRGRLLGWRARGASRTWP